VADSDDNPAPQDSKNGPWPVIGLVVVITLIAIWLVPGDETPETTEPARPAPSLLAPGEQPPAATPEAQPETAPAEPQPEAEVPAEAPPALGPGDAARALISELRVQSPPDLQRAFAAAQQHQQAGELDDAYLLYFYAAREGHGEAAMLLARQSDPASFSEDGLIAAADELQAHKWYVKAQQAGVDAAAEALAALRSRVEQAAEQGDDRARRIMLQWK